MKLERYLFCFLIWLSTFESYSQLSLGTSTPDSAAILEVAAADKGLLVPMISDTTLITSPVDGMMVFHESPLNKYLYYLAGKWMVMTPEAAEAGQSSVTITGTLTVDNIIADGYANNALFPTGSIIMWYGTAAGKPDGWSVYTALNGKFVVGAGDLYSPHDEGGSNTTVLTVDNMPLHTHDKGTLAISSSGDHSHGYFQQYFNFTGGTSGIGLFSGASAGPLTTQSSIDGHTHTGVSFTGTTGSAGSGASFTHPFYRTVIFLIKD